MPAPTPDRSELILPDPDLVVAQVDPHGRWASPAEASVDVVLSRPDAGGLRVDVGAPGGVSRVALRWHRPLDSDAVVLGDAWERSYADLQWLGSKPERPRPWMFLVHEADVGITWGAGVEVRAGSFACWTVDPHGFSLWLDLRAGDAPVRAGGRHVHAATVRAVAGDARPWIVQCHLTDLLCADPLLPPTPLVGANNWYYAYGKKFDAGAVLRDARMIAELVGGHPIRPFAVVDDGWSIDGTADGRPASGGPWDRGREPTFGDMEQFAGAVRAEGVRPGIWYRPLLVRDRPVHGLHGERSGAYALDMSHPATLQTVAEDIQRFVGWGFDLIKHDFSTYDAFGRFGFSMGPSVTGGGGQAEPPGWAPADPTRTNAEAVVAFYRTIRDAAGEAIILGCNVFGHLAAGLVHAQRIGDDTSGREWERTRRYGVNTLAFRLAQHGRFFAADADCVPSTPQTDWQKNRQFLDLIARSGTALFVSVDPTTRNAAVDADLSAALRLALDGGVPGGVEPLDWLGTSTPERWRSGDDEVRYDWIEAIGADPYAGHA